MRYSVGDVLDALLALLVLKSCRKVDGGLPASLGIRMMMNIAIDFVVGLVPFAGDLLDAMFRANTRNAILLEEHLREKGRQNLKKAGKPIPTDDPSRADFFDNHPEPDPQVVAEPPSRHHSTNVRTDRTDPRHSRPAQPEAARVKESRGWWGRGRSRTDDVEAGRGPAR